MDACCIYLIGSVVHVISIKVCVCGWVRVRAGTPDLYLHVCVNVHRYVHMYT